MVRSVELSAAAKRKQAKRDCISYFILSNIAIYSQLPLYRNTSDLDIPSISL